MKKVLVFLSALVLVTLSVMTMASCGKEPHYYIGDVTYDPVQKKLDWTDNSDATSWIVIINGDKHKTDVSEYSFDAGNKDFTFSIEGLHEKEGKDKNPKISGTMRYLPTPTNVRIQDGALHWDPVPGAENYEVLNFGNWFNTTDQTNIQVPAGSFSYSVKATLSGFSYSYASTPIEGTILVAPTNLRYENGILQWDYAGQGVEFFTVTINGTDYKTTDIKMEYNGNKSDFTVSVKACASGVNSYDSEPLASTCHYLEPITEFSFDESGNLTWGAVENAEGYSIELNGVMSTSVEPLCGNLALDTPYAVKVIPTSSGLSYTSEPIQYRFEKLSPIENVKFSAETNTITWNRHERATSYELIVNGETFNVNEPQYTIGRTEEDISIKVYAKGEMENSKSFFATETNYTYMGTLGAPTIVDGKLVWTASETASRYVVTFLDGTTKETNVAELTDFTKGMQHTVTVTSYGENEYYFSYPSAPFTFFVLNSPTLSFSQNAIVWNTNEDASGYYVKVTKDGEDFDVKTLGTTTLTYSNTYQSAGKYEIRVKATSSVSGIFDSEYSPAFEIVRLATPDGHKILNDVNNTDYLHLSVNQVNGAQAYSVTVNGSVMLERVNTSTFNVDILSLVDNHDEANFNIGIKALGSNSTSSPIYLDSVADYTFTVTRLATPKNVAVSGKTVTWDPVKNASKYVVSVNGTRYVANSNSYTLPAISEGTTKIVIYALSDSTDVINSRPSEELSVRKLPKVTGVDIIDVNGDTRVTWTAVDGATSYTVKIGTQEYNATVNAQSITSYLSSITEGNGVQITIYAKGDGKTTIDSEPSDTLTISRFRRPDAIKVNGGNITWNECSINGVVAATYQLQINGESVNATGTSFSTAELEPGTYTVKAKALGDKKHTLDSEFSSSIQVTKLAPVGNLRTEAGTKRIVWDAVAGAEEYVVRIDGKDHITRNTYYEFSATTAGSYTIEVYPHSNAANTINGTPTSLTVTVHALATPQKADTQSGAGTFTITQNGSSYTVTIQAPAEAIPSGMVKYTVFVSGMRHDLGTATSYNGTMELSDHEYKIKVQYTVSCFGNDGIYYIDSNESREVSISFS